LRRWHADQRHRRTARGSAAVSGGVPHDYYREAADLCGRQTGERIADDSRDAGACATSAARGANSQLVFVDRGDRAHEPAAEPGVISRRVQHVAQRQLFDVRKTRLLIAYYHQKTL